MEIFFLLALLKFQASGQDVKKWEADLGSADFVRREEATARLNRAGSQVKSLLSVLEKSRNLEVARRVRDIRERRRFVFLDSLEPYPEIDCLLFDLSLHCYRYGDDDDDPFRTAYRIQVHRKYLKHFCNHHHCFRYATRLWFTDLYEQGFPEWKLRMLWFQMHIMDHRAGFGYWDRYLRPYYPWKGYNLYPPG